MHTRLRLYFLSLALVALLIFTYSCNNKIRKGSISDRPLAAFQKKLLDVAFETASAISVKPHIKDRSRAQGVVVETCLRLDQPKRALGYIEKIDNWRRGLWYANLALYCAGSNFNKEAEHYLELAGQIAKEDHGQEWRNNRIKSKMAETRIELGQTKQAKKLKKDLGNSETDDLAKVKAKINVKEPFDEQVKVLDGLIGAGEYIMVKYALQTYANLFNRFYDDESKRLLAEKKIRSSWGKMPVFIQVELLIDLAGFALEHLDKNNALDLVNEAQVLLDGSQWRLEYRIAFMAKLSELRFKAGDVERARTDADTSLNLFNTQKSEIVNIYRAEAIIPLAQAYQSMGDTEAALSVYKIAVEESVENPNSRPRAEDLSAICCSMAFCAVEPDSELWARIYQISEELGKSW